MYRNFCRPKFKTQEASRNEANHVCHEVGRGSKSILRLCLHSNNKYECIQLVAFSSRETLRIYIVSFIFSHYFFQSCTLITIYFPSQSLSLSAAPLPPRKKEESCTGPELSDAPESEEEEDDEEEEEEESR